MDRAVSNEQDRPVSEPCPVCRRPAYRVWITDHDEFQVRCTFCGTYWITERGITDLERVSHLGDPDDLQLASYLGRTIRSGRLIEPLTERWRTVARAERALGRHPDGISVSAAAPPGVSLPSNRQTR